MAREIEEFKPVSPPEGLVDGMIKDSLSCAWAICVNVKMVKDQFVCSETGERCFVFQDGIKCAKNPANNKAIGGKE